jgi:hypothetical protein
LFCAPVFDEDGELTYFLSTQVDVTASHVLKRRRRAQLRANSGDGQSHQRQQAPATPVAAMVAPT